MATIRFISLFLVLVLTLTAGCTRLPPRAQAPLQPKSVAELKGYLLEHKADLDLFRLRGPFAVTEEKNRELRLPGGARYRTDLFLTATAEKVPLVIFLHGYDSSKEAHAYQAEHVASWGMHCLTLQLPNKGAWVGNGRTLLSIVSFIQQSPQAIDSRVDPSRVILVGHSFGGSAVASAMGRGAPAVGAILLDPAAVGRDLPALLQQVRKPVMVLGADDQMVSTRNRDYFYRFVQRSIAEVSIRDATHEDAQYPSEYSLQNHGSDPYTTEEGQVSFLAALTASALSLGATGTFDYAWSSFGPVVAAGKFFNPRRK